MVAWPFRQVPSDELAASSILMACRKAGLVVTTLHQAAGRKQARFTVRTPTVSMEVSCDAAAWYAGRFPALRDVAWDVVVDQPGAERLVAPDATVWLSDPQLRQAVVTFAGLDHARAPSLADGTAVALRMDHGEAWVRSVRLIGPGATSAGTSCLLPVLPVHVDLRLGIIRMSAATLHRLVPGSIVLLDPIEPRGCISGRPAFDFTFTQTEITLMSTFDFLDEETDVDASINARPSPGEAFTPVVQNAKRRMDAVPVGVEVILCRLSRTVSQLGDLAAGATMELPEDAWKHVELRANGVPVATGELVQIGGQVGVMLHEAATTQ